MAPHHVKGKIMIEFTHATTRYTVKPENAQEYRRLAANPPKIKRKVDAKNDSMKRTYPEFYAGMTTRDYVTEYAAINSRLLLSETLFNYTDRPAPMLDAAQPEVLEELDADYVSPAWTPSPKKQTIASLKAAIAQALEMLQAGDVDTAQCVLSEAVK
jgi:hypothetical protein